MVPRSRSKKYKDYPDNLYSQNKGGKEYFFYRHPISGNRTHWGAIDKKRAFAAARQLNGRLFQAEDIVSKVELSEQGIGLKNGTFEYVIDRYESEILPASELKPGSIKARGYQLNRIKKDLGSEVMQNFPLYKLAEYLDTNFAKNPYVKHRQCLIDLYRFAKTKGIYTHRDNPAEETQTSKNDQKKKRQRLIVEGFKAVHSFKDTPQYLRDAMDLSLITLQGRFEIVSVKFTDEVDGHLHFIREKTKDQTEKAFIRIPVTEKLSELITRCRMRDDYVSPFLISRKPARRLRSDLEAKEHWTQILPDYFGKQFAFYRDACGYFDHIPKDERPTFHEIRALGGDLYVEQGYSKEYVSALMGHTKIATTEIYLKGHGRINWSTCDAELDYEKVFKGQ